MTGRNWTELFFLDEATAFAAGHRPCGYCRRAAYDAFVTGWETATGLRPKAPVMDKALHQARVSKDRRQMRFEAFLCDLPNGSFLLWMDEPHLLWHSALYPYQPEGYGEPIPTDKATIVSVLTPMPTVAVLKAGYVPQVCVT